MDMKIIIGERKIFANVNTNKSPWLPFKHPEKRKSSAIVQKLITGHLCSRIMHVA